MRYFDSSVQVLNLFSEYADNHCNNSEKAIEAHINDRIDLAINYLVRIINDEQYIKKGSTD